MLVLSAQTCQSELSHCGKCGPSLPVLSYPRPPPPAPTACPGKEGPSSPGITERSLLRSAQAYSLWRVPWEQGGFEHVLRGLDRAFSEDAGNSLAA